MKKLVLFSLLTVSSIGLNAQNIVFGTPVSQPSRTKFTVAYFRVEVDPRSRIEIGVKDDGTGLITIFSYPDSSVAALDTEAKVATLIGQFNVANLSTSHTTPVTTGSLKYRLADILCRDFPTRMPSGSCTVQ